MGCVNKPLPSAFWSHNVDYPTYCVRTEAHWNDTAIGLYALSKIDRDIVKPETAADTLLRDSVNENFDMFPAEAIHRYRHIRAYTPLSLSS